MPTLSITRNYADSTVLDAGQLDDALDSIETLLNSTKLDSTNIQTSGVETDNIAAAAVTAAKLASSSVTTAKLADDAVTTAKVLDANVTLAKLAAAVQASLCPAGTMNAYAGTSAPTGWLLCDGSAVSRTTYAALFAVIGEAYGEGDNSTTFNVPDTRGLFLRGYVDNTGKTFATTDVNTGTDVITVSSHGFNRTGFPVRFTTSGTLPAGLSLATTYYLVVASSSTFKVASSLANAIAGTTIDITSTGAGTHTVTQYVDPDVSSRAAYTVGASGLGLYQADQNSSHNHAITDGGHTHQIPIALDSAGSGNSGLIDDYYADNTASGMSGVAYNTISSITGISLAASGGNEARPKNLYCQYIIKT